MNDETYIYEKYDDGYIIVRKDATDSCLIGDQLPGTEKEAKLLCRVANLAASEAREEVIEEFKEMTRKLIRKLEFEA